MADKNGDDAEEFFNNVPPEVKLKIDGLVDQHRELLLRLYTKINEIGERVNALHRADSQAHDTVAGDHLARFYVYITEARSLGLIAAKWLGVPEDDHDLFLAAGFATVGMVLKDRQTSRENLS